MRKQSGFTLIELLVVIAIIALLLSILMPALNKVKDAGRAVVCANNLSQIGKAMVLYANDNKGFIMRAEFQKNNQYAVWQALYAPYMGGNSSLLSELWELDAYNCPSYPDKEQVMDYILNVWKYDQSSMSGSETHEPTKLTNVRNTGGLIYSSEYACYTYNIDTATNKRTTSTGNSSTVVKIVTIKDLQDAQAGGIDALYNLKLRWMDIYRESDLPSAPASVSNESLRRVEYNRHKKEGVNNLFFDGHVTWLPYFDNTPEKWRVRE
jgi:prepilin-type N-terminal cleavage/methylation domain-containing protein/prepilin-type processing-associated H-X9-DG protein